MYAVDQEQRVTSTAYSGLPTRSAWRPPENLRFQHLYFGFSSDAKTCKKLSSRDSASNVTKLLAAAKWHK